MLEGPSPPAKFTHRDVHQDVAGGAGHPRAGGWVYSRMLRVAHGMADVVQPSLELGVRPL